MGDLVGDLMGDHVGDLMGDHVGRIHAHPYGFFRRGHSFMLKEEITENRFIDNVVKQLIPIYANPIQECRKPTDRAFIILFAIIFLIWIGMTIQALVYPFMIVDEPENVYKNYWLFNVERYKLRLDWGFLLCTSVSATIAIIYMFLLLTPIIDHIIIYFSLVIVFALIIFYFGIVFVLYLGFGSILFKAITFFLLLCLAYQVHIFYCFAKIKAESVFEIIQEACRAILFYPWSMLFVCLMSVLIVTVLGLIFFVLGSISHHYDQYPHIMTYCVTEIFCAIVVITFVINFIQTVISGFVIDWFWTEDQNSVSCGFIWKHIHRTLRYHMGTVCFGSIPLLPNIWAIVQACGDVFHTKQIATKDNIFIRFISQISLIINVRDFALIQTSIYGINYVTSIKEAIDLVTQNPKMHLAVTETTNSLAWIGVYLTILPFEYHKPSAIMYSIPVPIFIILITAFRALLVNRMIMDNATENVKGLVVCVQDSATVPIYNV